MTARLERWLSARRGAVERALRRLPGPGVPRGLSRPMRHSLLAGGKRLRPLLALAAAEACGGRRSDAFPAALAAELIHTYSLIHDDLPAMDDDDLRRGRPTCHKAFGEAAAILAGDALLTLAFELAARGRPDRAARTVRALARGAGPAGMVAGQTLDLANEGRRPGRGSLRALETAHRLKTAALIAASLEAGAAAVGASGPRRRALRRCGEALGMAFQVTDDVLDRAGERRKLGKRGSDLANRKLTYPAVLGLEGARRLARRLAARAKAALGPFGERAWMLRELADFVVERDR